MGGISTQYRIKTQLSVTQDGNGIKLVNDAASPGNSYSYGTTTSGVKGWKQDFVIDLAGNMITPYWGPLPSLTTASENIFLGVNNAYSIQTGSRNNIIGTGSSMYFATNAQYMTSFGHQNFASATNPYASTAVGVFNDNTIVGSYNATFGYGNLTGTVGNSSSIAAFGYSNVFNTAGTNLIGIGHDNIQASTAQTPSYVIGIGAFNYTGLTTGSNLISVGWNNGQTVTTGTNNYFFGRAIVAGNAARTNSVYLGSEILGSQNNQFIVGGNGQYQITSLYLGGSPTNTADDNGQKSFIWAIPERYQPVSGNPDQPGHELKIYGSRGIGQSIDEGQGGNITFFTQDAGASGTQLNTLVERFGIFGGSGDIRMNSYANSRDDSGSETLTNMLSTDANGRILSFLAGSDYYSPTITGDGSHTLLNAGYIRTGNIVTGHVRFECDLSTMSGSNANVIIDLPVSSSFSNTDDVMGTIMFFDNTAFTFYDNTLINYDGSSNRIRIRFGNVNAGWTGPVTTTITFLYKVM